MYYVQFCFDGRFKTIGTFNSYDSAINFIRYNNVVHDIDCNLVQIVHKGMVITLNENSLKKAFL